MLRLMALFIIGALCGPLLLATAQADTCLPGFTSLDVIEPITFGTPSTFSKPLKSENVSGIFATKATLEGSFDGKTLTLVVKFNAEGVSLPYNIYALLVASPEEAIFWQDLTDGCTGPGISIFPGQSFKFTHVKMTGEGTKDLHVVLWGRL